MITGMKSGIRKFEYLEYLFIYSVSLTNQKEILAEGIVYVDEREHQLRRDRGVYDVCAVVHPASLTACAGVPELAADGSRRRACF